MTTWVRYEGPGHLLKLSDTLYLGLGSAAPVDDELAQTLLDSPDIFGVVTVVGGPNLAWPNSHVALDALAEKFTVTFPSPAAGKQKLSVGEKVAALEAAGRTPADIPDDKE